MNKIDTAWSVLKSLTPREQEIAADAILDYATAAAGPTLSDGDAQEVERRIDTPDVRTMTAAELRSRIEKLLP